jgi:hypothetical protein
MRVDIDTRGYSYVQGFINGFSKGANNANFMSAVLDYTHADLNTRFELMMDIIAAARPKNLMHVYEWGQLGKPNGRLWESVLRGRGTDRIATVVWKASKKAVPVRPELLEPGPSGQKVKEGVHIFYWKAPVMEAGLEITVSPVHAQSLAYVNSTGDLVITKKPSTFEAGGGNTKGQFTAVYYDYWTRQAHSDMQKHIMPKLVKDFQLIASKGIRSRRKAYSIGGDAAAFKTGANLGFQGLSRDFTRNYEAAAAARRALLYGG